MKPLSRFVVCLLLAAPLAAAGLLSEPDATVVKVCAEKKTQLYCAPAQLQAKQTKELLARATMAPRPVKDLVELDSMNRTCSALTSSAFDLQDDLAKAGLTTSVFWTDIYAVQRGLRKLSETTLKGRLSDLTQEVLDLEKAAAAAARSSSSKADRTAMVRQLGAQGGEVFGRFRTVSISIDHMGRPTEAPVMGLRESANALALRLAAVRDRLLALQRSLSLPLSVWDFNGLVQAILAPETVSKAKVNPKAVPLPAAGSFPAATSPGGVPASGPAAASGPKPPAVVSTGVTPKNLLDVPRIKPPLPSIISKAWKPEFDNKAKLLHWTGLSRTAGDPAGRASLVHHQDGSNTCAIVSQQQLLTAYGLIPKGDAIKTEKQLTLEARAQGFFSEGTPPAYGGDLLVSHGMLVTKRAKATDAQLEAAAKRGKMIIVGMDAGLLWDDKKYVGSGHAIVVTGVEYAALGGKVLGYYVNDSGTNPPGRGRFVPADRFLKAWHKRDSRYIEAQ